MLDPWIIEEILRREEERRREQDKNRIEMPLESPRYRDNPAMPAPSSDEKDRGVVVIDI